MKRSLFVIALSLISLGVASSSFHKNNAIASTSSYGACQSAQTFIKQTVRRNDIRSRVNHLQLYEFTYDNLSAIATRLKTNNQPEADSFQKTVSDYRTNIDSFKSNYEKYDVSRDQLTNFKVCSDNIKQFNLLLANARQKRQAVDKDVSRLNRLLDVTVSSQLDDLLSVLQSRKGGL